MLQQAVEQVLRERGWTVASDGRLLVAEKEGEELLLGFLRAGEAGDYLGRAAESSASLGAVLLEPLPDPEVARLEEAGVVCFRREEMEDVVVMAWFRKDELEATKFAQFVEGA